MTARDCQMVLWGWLACGLWMTFTLRWLHPRLDAWAQRRAEARKDCAE